MRYEEDDIDALGHVIWAVLKFSIAVIAIVLLITCVEST